MISLKEVEAYTIEDDNICFINGEIDCNTAEYVVRFLLEKNSTNSKRNINQKDNIDHIKMIINSPGGTIYDAFAIIDSMNASALPVFTYGLGQIASCGLMIFMSGNQDNRYIFKNTSILSHQWSGGSEGKEHEIRASEKENKLVSKRIHNLYTSATGLSKDEIDKFLLAPSDTFLTPNEAVKFRLADRIIAHF